MSLFALIAALMLEQVQPLSSRKYLYGWLSGYVGYFQHHFNAGQRRHGKVAWVVAVVPLVAAVMLGYWLLHRVHPLLAWAFNVLVLYLTMGFREFSHYFGDILHALREDKLDTARTQLSAWREIPSHELNREEVARVTIEEALLASHRNVFAVIVWFVLFSVLGLGGAAGAMLYRLGQFLRHQWSVETDPELREFGRFARQAFSVLEWLPIRITAAIFAIVGDFEDTIYCWRTQAANWPDPGEGILLASGAGALGVRLGMPLPFEGILQERPELGIGDEADPDFMRSTIGLVWRSVIFILLLLLILTLASLLG